MAQKPLNKKQRDAIELLISKPFIKKGDVAKEVGVNPATVSQWMKRDDFIAEWDRRLAEEWQDSIRSAQRKMQELADNGNYKAVEYICNAGGFKAPDKVEVESSGFNIKIGYDDKPTD